MNQLKYFFLSALAAAMIFTGCDNDDDNGGGTDPGDDCVVVRQNITSNTTWTSDNCYRLAGRIAVESGVTLTIEAGTIIKGEAGTGANATALVIARGATLNANGTASAPIIFTSVADEITPEDVAAGNFGSPNLDPDINGLWGGLIVLGSARISAPNNAEETNIEGIPTSDPNGLYGGTDDTDNSGTITYISIRHGGSNIGEGNEINGLTLGGVGSGTTIENVEIVANQDDGIEWFGGTASITNALVWNVGDDGMDTDQGWSGTMNNFIVITPAGHCFELDGPEGDPLPNGQHTFTRGSVIASDEDRTSEDLINTDDNTNADLENIFITGIADGQVINRINATATFTNVQLDVEADSLFNYVNGADNNSEVPAGITAGTTKQADAGVFGWTWAADRGAFSAVE